MPACRPRSGSAVFSRHTRSRRCCSATGSSTTSCDRRVHRDRGLDHDGKSLRGGVHGMAGGGRCASVAGTARWALSIQPPVQCRQGGVLRFEKTDDVAPVFARRRPEVDRHHPFDGFKDLPGGIGKPRLRFGSRRVERVEEGLRGDLPVIVHAIREELGQQPIDLADRLDMQLDQALRHPPHTPSSLMRARPPPRPCPAPSITYQRDTAQISGGAGRACDVATPSGFWPFPRSRSS